MTLNTYGIKQLNKRDKSLYGIDYGNTIENDITIYSELKGDKIHNFLLTLESKGEIKEQNLEIIYTSLAFLSNTKKGVVMGNLADGEILFSYE